MSTTIHEDINALLARTAVFEDELTTTLGFVIPEKLTMEDAFELLTAIQDPLRTEIKTRLLTAPYALNENDVRWNVLSVLIRFGLRFGGMREVAQSFAQELHNAIDKTADRVYLMLREENRVPMSRFGYFKSCVKSLNASLWEYDDRRLKLMTKENFNMFEDCGDSRPVSVGASTNSGIDETFASLSETITTTGRELCTGTSSYLELPSCVRDLTYCDTPAALLQFKKKTEYRIRSIQIFNEILDSF